MSPRPSRTLPALLFVWGSAALFAISLAYFLFTYAVSFGRMSGGPITPQNAAINAALFTGFALHHSIFARGPIRRAVARRLPGGLERSFYVVVASVLLILVCAWWRPLPGVAWHATGAAAWMLYAVQAAGLWLTIRGAAVIGIRRLAGLVNDDVPPAPGSESSGGAEFKTEGPYGWVRHPIYSGWFLIVFGAPVMTLTRLEFATISAVYILAAIPLEERTLRAAAGAAYRRYIAEVRWRLLPGVY